MLEILAWLAFGAIILLLTAQLVDRWRRGREWFRLDDKEKR